MPHTPNNSASHAPVDGGDGGDPDMLVVLTTARTEFEAQTLAEALRARGIRAEVFGTAGAAVQPGMELLLSFQVMVSHADLDEAKDALAEAKSTRANFDWSEAQDHEFPPESAGDDDKRLEESRRAKRQFQSNVNWTTAVVVVFLAILAALMSVGGRNAPLPPILLSATVPMLGCALWYIWRRKSTSLRSQPRRRNAR